MAYERKEDAVGNNQFPSTAYGPVTAEDVTKLGAKVGGDGNKNIFNYEWIIDLSDDPTTSAFNNQIATLDALSVILSVDMQVLETIAGGTSFTVGLSEPDGSVIDADGLVAANTSTAVGSYKAGAGALVGTTITPESQLTIGGDRTSGKIKVQVNCLKTQV